VPNIKTLKKKKDFKNSATMGKMIRMNNLSIRFFDSKTDFSRFGFVILKDLLNDIPNYDYLIAVYPGINEVSYEDMKLEIEKIYTKIRKFDKNI